MDPILKKNGFSKMKLDEETLSSVCLTRVLLIISFVSSNPFSRGLHFILKKLFKLNEIEFVVLHAKDLKSL